MPLFTSLLLILIIARAAGELAERAGQPAMIGEIVAGVLLGPTVFNLVAVSPELRGIADLGVFFLVLLAGMEVEIPRLAEAVRGRNLWIAVLGFLVPLGMGMAVGWLFGFDAHRILFLGLCLAITALPVSVRILMDVGGGALHSRPGQMIVSAAVLNDVAALLVLGVILATQGGDGSLWGVARSTLWGAAKTAFFIMLVVGVYRLVEYSTGVIPHSRHVITRVLDAVRGKETLFAITVGFVLLFAMLSETVGLHFVAGTFFGGAIISRRILGSENFREVERTTSAVTMGLLAPVFFALIGLEFDASSLTSWGLTLAVLGTAFASKILGGYLGGLLAGLPPLERWLVGLGLNGRGIMELVIANLALSMGFIGPRLFSILILMTLITTILTPVLLKPVWNRLPEETKAA